MTTTATLSEFARHIKRSPSYVTKLKQAGRLVLVENEVDVAASIRRIEESASGRHERGREYQRRQRGEQKTPAGAEGAVEGETPGKQTRAYWDNRLAEANAKLKEKELAERDGDLIPRADVDFVLNDYGATLRGLLENTADRLAPQVFPMETLEETHAVLSEAMEELQREMAETMKRRVEGMGQ
jgi:phage terminase Nu1 subunit (DNA packaging protein)